MKRIILLLVTIFSMCCLVACGGEKDSDANAGSNNNEPEITAEPTLEPTAEPTVEPIQEAAPEPTVKPSVVYEGIDMDSALNGQDWLETFVGVIDEPKVVIFSDITGKKVIIEQDAEVTFNPDEDAMALFFPEGYTNGNVTKGIVTSDEIVISTKNYEIFYLDAAAMREKGECNPAFLVMKGDERVVLKLKMKIE